MPKKILILSASVGAGHIRAAEAVEVALRESVPGALVERHDVLSMTNAGFRQIYGKAYLDLVNHAPHVLGYMYDLMDRPQSKRARGDRLRLMVEKLNLKPLTQFLVRGNWDVIVNTHFLPAEIISSLRRRQTLDVPQMTVTTDFETHRLWVNQPCDLYTTATAEGADYLATWGVPRDTIQPTGIPIHPDFTRHIDRDQVLQTNGLDGDRPVVLQLAGGFGVGPIAKIYDQILSMQRPVQVVVVAGKNEKVKEELETVEVPSRHRAKVLGFTSRMHELMSVADLVVTKPGGLTSSEVFASGAAMAIVNPIPGQESRNSDYILEQGAGIKINNLPTLAGKLEALLQDDARLSSLKQNAKRIGRPRAAFDVAKLAMDLAGT